MPGVAVRGFCETKVPFVTLAGQFVAMVTVWNVSGLACQNEDILWTVGDCVAEREETEEEEEEDT